MRDGKHKKLCQADEIIQLQTVAMPLPLCSQVARRGVDDGQHDNWRLDGAASEIARFSDQMVIDEKLG